MMRLGPAGLGAKVQEAAASMERYAKLGIRACEKWDIKLSIHAPYWINLNSSEKRKIEESKKRILDSCKIGELLGAKIVVFHAGFYGKIDREISFLNIKKAVLEMLEEIKKNKWKIKIAAETMGKINVFGSAEEILRLVKETGCS
ncbi:MAG: TIM barrel protein, partial [Nanoarchaeota archaeon]|nr:TIM barrel protein [Nanoarchaeota archaeon]